MGILSVDLNNINLDDVKYDDDDPEAIIHVRLVSLYNKCKQRKSFENYRSKVLVPVPWHPTSWWDWCMPEDKEKGIEPNFTETFEKWLK